MPSEHFRPDPDQAPHLSREDGGDLIVQALHHLRRSHEADSGAYWKTNSSRLQTSLEKWGKDLGLDLSPENVLPFLKRGGQEHDVFSPDQGDRIFKLTRNGVFGFEPGIELAMVASSQDARRFHLWEASPYFYLERLLLQNTHLTPGLNRLEGFICRDQDFAILTSQPRFQLNPVTQVEIDEWFISLGFQVITSAAYYRKEDNLGVFDAHDKNVVRAGDTLVLFDVIPCHPDGGFLAFIEESTAKGQTLTTVRSTS